MRNAVITAHFFIAALHVAFATASIASEEDWKDNWSQQREPKLWIVMNLYQVTDGIQELCQSAPSDVQAGLRNAARAFEDAYPALMTLVRSHPRLSEAQAWSRASIQRQTRKMNQEVLGQLCLGNWNQLTNFANKRQDAMFNRWLDELQK